MSIRVLLADRDLDLLQILDELLSLDQFEVLTATTGPKCAEILRQWKPDVFVLELDLAGGWSDRLLEMMGTALEIPEVPTIVLSRFNEERPTYLTQPSVKAFLVKPTSIVELKTTIRNANQG